METRTVAVNLNELVEGDFDDCLDLFEELFFAEDDGEHRGILSDITYEVVGVITHENQVLIAVTGEPEETECYNDSCERCYGDLDDEDDDEDDEDE